MLVRVLKTIVFSLVLLLFWQRFIKQKQIITEKHMTVNLIELVVKKDIL